MATVSVEMFVFPIGMNAGGETVPISMNAGGEAIDCNGAVMSSYSDLG